MLRSKEQVYLVDLEQLRQVDLDFILVFVSEQVQLKKG